MPRYSPGYVKKRGRIWHIYYSIPGQGERSESSGSLRKADAQALLARRIAERDQGILPTSGSRLPLRVMLEALERDFVLRSVKSLRQLRAHLKALAWFDRLTAAQATEARIDQYILHRQALGKAAATINYELGLLGQALRLAVRRRQLTQVPHIRQLPVANVRQGFLSPADVQALCAHLTPVIADVVQFALTSGWRRGEILTLAWRDVDWQGAVIRLRPEHSKTGHGRVLPVNETLRMLLERRLNHRTLLTPLVFHREGRRITDFARQWHAACNKAGLGRMLFHDLRRSAALAMERAGVHERVAMALLGHTTTSMHRRYKIVQEGELREAMAKLEQAPSTRTVHPLGRETR